MIKVSGINLYFEKSDKGDALILLHGKGEDYSILLRYYRNSYKLYSYAVDSRNHGLSEKTAVYDIDVMTADIYAWIKALAISPVNILVLVMVRSFLCSLLCMISL